MNQKTSDRCCGSLPVVKTLSYRGAQSESNALLWLCLTGHIIAETMKDVDQVAERALQGQFSGHCCSSVRMQFPKVMPLLRKAQGNLFWVMSDATLIP